MPTIAVREPEQLSLFDLLENTGARAESARPRTVITIPVATAPLTPMPAESAAITAHKKAAAAKKPTPKEKIAAIAKEPLCAAFFAHSKRLCRTMTSVRSWRYLA